MTDLTDDEFSVLLIAAQGESMIPIGRWQKPVESLVAKGFLFRQDQNNNTITNAGRRAVEARDNADAKALIEVAAAMPNIRAVADGMATALAGIARESNRVTGDAPADAARKWSEIILTRALELLGERK